MSGACNHFEAFGPAPFPGSVMKAFKLNVQETLLDYALVVNCSCLGGVLCPQAPPTCNILVDHIAPFLLPGHKIGTVSSSSTSDQGLIDPKRKEESSITKAPQYQNLHLGKKNL